MKIYQKNIKRIIDIIFATILFIVLIPVFIIIAIIIKLTDKGPILFMHTRIGKDGKSFKLYKFRTMVIGAEELIKEFSKEQLEEYRKNYKLKNDPRVTRIGKILRKSCLDELPQLINIIKGDLSFVGPRPIVKDELEKYKDKKEKFVSVKPGVTGYWVVNANPNTTYEERIKMELYYIDNISFKLDLKILFKTISTIISRIIKTGD